jgi:hypothetical protein
MRLLLLLGFSGLLLLGLMGVIGLSIQPSATSEHSAYFAQKPSEVFELLRKVDEMASWRPSLQYIEVGAQQQVKETYERGTQVEYELRSDINRLELFLEELERSDGFRGNWKVSIEGVDGGTFITVREEGVIKNPILRTVDHFFVGRHYWVKLFLEEMSERLDSELKGTRFIEPAPPPGV